MDDVHDEEFTSVIGDLISIPVLDGELSAATAGLDIHRIARLAGPVQDMPLLITPEELIWIMLWQFLRPKLPVRPREIEEFIADELGELDIDPPELGAEEEVEKLLTYRPIGHIVQIIIGFSDKFITLFFLLKLCAFACQSTSRTAESLDPGI
jgi:hypothetical protein